MKLVQAGVNQRRAQLLLALESGAYGIEFQYQLAVAKKDSESSITLPVQYGLVNQVSVTLLNLDVDVVSPQAVAVERKASGKDTVATLILSPVNDIVVGWRPRSRDLAKEKTLAFEKTALWRAVRAAWRKRTRSAPPYARLPEVTLQSPKLSRSRTTTWFAKSVDQRYAACRRRERAA